MAMEVTALDAAVSVRRVEWRAVAAGAAGVLLLALMAGALIAPSAPSPLSHRLRVHEYFVAHHDAALNQSVLVHGVVGAALAVLVVALWWGSVRRRLFLVAGLAAAVASLIQLFIVFRIEHHIESGVGVRQTDALFDALNRAGAVKLGLMAIALAAASTYLPRRLRWTAWAVIPVLGFAFFTRP
jgi:ribose/xylose/arabinose/galactoside ABC-type transport system permease subunit